MFQEIPGIQENVNGEMKEKEQKTKIKWQTYAEHINNYIKPKLSKYTDYKLEIGRVDFGEGQGTQKNMTQLFYEKLT